MNETPNTRTAELFDAMAMLDSEFRPLPYR
jgi:hypothetical protein